MRVRDPRLAPSLLFATSGACARVAKQASAREPSLKGKRTSAGLLDRRWDAVPDAEAPIGTAGRHFPISPKRQCGSSLMFVA